MATNRTREARRSTLRLDARPRRIHRSDLDGGRPGRGLEPETGDGRTDRSVDSQEVNRRNTGAEQDTKTKRQADRLPLLWGELLICDRGKPRHEDFYIAPS